MLRRLTPALHAGTAGVSLPHGAQGTRRDAHRSFDPSLVGALECSAWVAYYRRDWLAFLTAAVRVSRHVFGLSWRTTIQCSWLVLRANQLWAPANGNGVQRSRRMMERFYAIVQGLYEEPFDPASAAALEIEWWRVHRDHQLSGREGSSPELADALARLYAHVYSVPQRTVTAAAQQRALAMRHSDQWVRAGCDPSSELIDLERAALVRSYSALLAAVRQRPDNSEGTHHDRDL